MDWLRNGWGCLTIAGVVYDTASVGIMHALAVAREEKPRRPLENAD